MKQEVKSLIQESQAEFAAAGVKGAAGFTGAAASMTINDMAGLVVAVLTAIYMVFQIESAWRKRKAAKKADCK